MLLLQLLIFFDGLVDLKGLSWPSGTYGIPRPLVGCPDGEGVKWKTGWRREHLEKKNQIPKPSHLNASVILNGQGIERSFCIKVISETEERETLWPAGEYCIYKYGQSCPKGLKSGSLHWDDVNHNNTNGYGGILPQGNYDNDTTIQYCCQDSVDWNEPIDLPFDKPFYLLPYKLAVCQHVKWTVRSLETIVYDTEDHNNNDWSSGYHAHVKQGESLVTEYYCYYKACRQTLRNNTGSFSSYGNSHQYCSWTIEVKEMFVITLTFSQLKIPDCRLNHLDIYEGLDEKSTLLTRYCGSNATKPVSLNSTGNALFVMLKAGGNFDGPVMEIVDLKAEYITNINSTKIRCHFTYATNASNGSVTSPMYPSGNFPANQNCSWKVTMQENHFISLTFHYLYLPNCNNNYIKIYDGPSTMSPLLTKLCKPEIATRSTWNSTGNSLYIVYKSGQNNEQDVQKIIGFSASYIKCSRIKHEDHKLLSTQTVITQRLFKTTEKPLIETTPTMFLGVSNTRKNSSGSSKVNVIVTVTLLSSFVLLLAIFIGLYILRRRVSSEHNNFFSRRNIRKESENPIYEQTNHCSSNNPLYSSTSAIPVYEEPNIKRDIQLSI